MKAKYLIKGIIKNIPGINHIYKFNRRTGGTNNARYCYSVWLRHLIYAHDNGFLAMPKKLAELGPGDSLGVGIAALISGVEQYFALDVVKYCDAERNLKIFDDLVELFRQRSAIPDEMEFPTLKPLLKDYDFPGHILSDDYLNRTLSESRLSKIRRSVEFIDATDIPDNDMMITYVVPWSDTSSIRHESLDMIVSQAVLQHIDDLSLTYKCMSKWIKPNGLISHQIDFKSMGSADTWFGHWEYSDLEWKIIRGKKMFYINREPHSTHINFLKENNFRIICDIKKIAETKIDDNNLARRFRNSTSEDLIISGAFIQATK